MQQEPVITARVTQEIVDYRDEVVRRTGIKKRFFDEKVYSEYMKNHPLEADGGDDSTRKEERK